MVKIKAKGNVISSSILKSGRNQRKFASDCNISPVHLSRIINGNVNPSGEMAQKITQELNKEFDDLFEIVE